MSLPESLVAELSPEPDVLSGGLSASGQDKDVTEWLLNAASRAVKQAINGRQLGVELDELVLEFQSSGEAERLIQESAAVISVVGLYHVKKGTLSTHDLLNAAPDLVMDTALDENGENESFASRLADATEDFCLQAENNSRAIEEAAVDPLRPEQIELFNANVGSVRVIARSLIHDYNVADLEEAIADGNLGLVTGVRRFDLVKSDGNPAKAKAYIEKYIKGYILKGMRDRYGRLHKSKSDPEAIAEFEEKFGPDKTEVVRMIKPSSRYGTAHSLDKIRDAEEGEADFHEIVPDQTSYQRIIDSIYVKELLSRLFTDASLRDREVLYRSFCLDQSQSMIGRAMGMSQTHAGRIIKKHVAKLEDAEDTTLPVMIRE